MKFAPAAIGIIAAGVAGYFIEPAVRSSLDGMLKESEEPVVVEVVEEEESELVEVPIAVVEETPVPEPELPVEPAPMPRPAPADTFPKPPEWVAGLTPEQLPEKVTLKTMVAFPIAGTDQPMTLPSGAPVTPVRVEGNLLVISPFAGPIEGRVAVMGTDLVEVMGNKAPAPVTPPPIASVTPPPPAPGITLEPDPEPLPPIPGPLGAEAIVKLMQESIRNGEIEAFTLSQVLGWKAGEDESRDGVVYQTGLASYKAETIFGVKTIQAQALIEDGKVAKWVWPKTGMEIK